LIERLVVGKSRPRRHSKSRRRQGIRPAAAATREPAGADSPGFFSRHPWLGRTVLAIGAPVVFFCLLELGLWACGFGYPWRFFVQTENKDVLATNEWFVWFYQAQRSTRPHPVLLSRRKPDETLRIFVLGESAAMGTPDPSFGFARMLELMLERCFPGKRVEVVNAAMRGINSHVVVAIARQCAELQPDLFVVYMGNNEVCGYYGPGTFLGQHPVFIGPLLRLRRTRVYQLLRIALMGRPGVSGNQEQIQTQEFFRQQAMALTDPRRQVVYRSYRENLRRICDAAVGAGAGVLVATVPVNLRDCPPLASLHREGLTREDLEKWQGLYRDGTAAEAAGGYARAVTLYRAAGRIDSEYAELHFRMGRCTLALGDPNSAREHFSRARDLDALQFRTDSRLNEIARAAVGRYRGKPVRLVDLEKALARSNLSAGGIPGGELFYDHVHPNFEGDYEIARSLVSAAVELLNGTGAGGAMRQMEIPSLDYCARHLGFTAWDRVNTAAAMVKMTARAPFCDQLEHAERQGRAEQAVAEVMNRVDQKFVEGVLAEYAQAIAAEPDDWQIRWNLANLLYQLKRFGEAAEQLEYVVSAMPHVDSYRMLLGYSLAEVGQIDKAVEHFRRVLETHPHHEQARRALDWARNRR